MDKILINIHSMVDLITNSSTELFCYVKDKTKKQVKDMLESMTKEFGCTAVEFYVDDDCWLWDEEKGKEYKDKNIVSINWDYEIHHEPCKMMLKRLEEVFGDIKYDKS